VDSYGAAPTLAWRAVAVLRFDDGDLTQWMRNGEIVATIDRTLVTTEILHWMGVMQRAAE